MRPVYRILTIAALLAPGAVLAQGDPQGAQRAQPPARPAAEQVANPADSGFFRPAPDIALTTTRPVNPAGGAAANGNPGSVPATPDMADEVRAAEEARLERMERSMDRIETAHERAMSKPAPLPPIASPLDGTAPIMSPLDGTAPIVTPTNR